MQRRRPCANRWFLGAEPVTLESEKPTSLVPTGAWHRSALGAVCVTPGSIADHGNRSSADPGAQDRGPGRLVAQRARTRAMLLAGGVARGATTPEDVLAASGSDFEWRLKLLLDTEPPGA